MTVDEYVTSLEYGSPNLSQQGNRHVHWHIAPLPPGVPYSQQQLWALSHESGILDLSEDEKATLAKRIRRELRNDQRSDQPAIQ